MSQKFLRIMCLLICCCCLLLVSGWFALFLPDAHASTSPTPYSEAATETPTTGVTVTPPAQETPSPTPTATATPPPTATPSPTPLPSPSPTVSPTQSPTVSPTAVSTPTPAAGPTNNTHGPGQAGIVLAVVMGLVGIMLVVLGIVLYIFYTRQQQVSQGR